MAGGNALGRDLARLVGWAERAQEARGGHGRFGQRIHLMPPTGWMNDPNGLCQVDGEFHAFFQYGPFDVRGGVKLWGHAVSRDLLTWEHVGAPLLPDEPFDLHGVYSGSAVVEDGRIRAVYTGNVKLPDPDGAFDYVNRGREGNTVLVESADGGRTFGEKRLVLTPADYPADLTCHVRDPKVWREGDSYLMVLGARRRVEGPAAPCRFSALHGEGAGRDVGEILVWSSPDLVSWTLENRVRTPERFGFMWECPDYLDLPVGPADGPQAGGSQTAGHLAGRARFLCCSPQGAEGGAWDRRNMYVAGYFEVGGDILGDARLGAFRLWDAGFDFYAPQTFEAADGRRIMIGWMGMPDEPSYGNDPTVEQGWQHCMTLPREVTASPAGGLLQAPVREIEGLRGVLTEGEGTLSVVGDAARCFDFIARGCEHGLHLLVHGALSVAWLPAEEGLPARLEMRFLDGSRSAAGCGRTVRWEPLARLNDLRVVGDASSVEVFANDGALVMSTRIYPDAYGIEVEASGAELRFWPLG